MLASIKLLLKILADYVVKGLAAEEIYRYPFLYLRIVFSLQDSTTGLILTNKLEGQPNHHVIETPREIFELTLIGIRSRLLCICLAHSLRSKSSQEPTGSTLLEKHSINQNN
jgi:hypothetical protein